MMDVSITTGTALRALTPFHYVAPGETHKHKVRKGRNAWVKSVSADCVLVDFGSFVLPMTPTAVAKGFLTTKGERLLAS